MVSESGKNYLIGNLLAGPGQWRRMYVTGATLTTLLKLFMIQIGVYPGLLAGNSTALGNYLLEVVNCMIPLLAVMLDQPVNGILTLVSNIILGALVWTGNYEASRGGF